MMGGKVRIADNVTIGSGAMLAAGSRVCRMFRPAQSGGGSPAGPAREWLKARLPCGGWRGGAAQTGWGTDE